MPWDHQHAVSADDQTLPLINIVFLLLVFFLLAGTLQAPTPLAIDDLELLTEDRQRQRAPNALLMSADGRLGYRGAIITDSELALAMFDGLNGPLAFHVDARADATRVIAVLRRLADIGIANVRLIGRGLSQP